MKKLLPISEIWRKFMRITITQLLLCVLCGSITFAHDSQAQGVLNRNITIVGEKIELKNVLSQIEKQAEIKFVYSTKIKSDLRLSLNYTNRKLSVVLDEILKPNLIDYEVIEDRILLKKSKIEQGFSPNEEKVESASKVATEMTVRGVVTDEKYEPIIGASVKIKGTVKGTVTDLAGKYSISVSEENAILIFSYVGYLSKEVAVAKRNNISISLLADNQALDEVVVVGYGTQSKKAITGSVASIGYDKFKDRSYSNVAQALAGQLAGVNISQGQGAPGVSPIIRIRGTSSITAGTNPLYVVDGLPVENFNLNLINPQDIASVEVLKDASSAAIYGSRGANGVIIVTTKLGKPGTTALSATVEYGVQKVIRQVAMMDAQQFIKYYKDAHNNAWIAAGGKASDPNTVRGSAYRIPVDFTTNPEQFGAGTNWQDASFKTASVRNVQISASGGTEKTKFLFSTGYLDQDAVLDQNYYKRLTLRANLQHDLTKKFRIGTNISLNSIFERTEGIAGKADVISLAQTNTPIFPIYNENGNLGFRDPNSTWYRFTQYSDLQLWHPYSITREVDRINKSYHALATAYVEYYFLDNLKFRSSINGNLSNNRGDMYQNALQKYGYSSAGPAIAESNTTSVFNWLSENTLTYDKQFGKNNITVLAGYTAQKQRDEYNQVTAGNFPNDLVHTLNAGTITGGTSLASEWSLLSYLGRINYSHANKYFLTATLRRDGSSRFGANNQFGYFPSASAAWVASDEDFMSNSKNINNLKFRVSYGVAGNNQIPNYGSVGLLGASNYTFANTLSNGLVVNNISNPDLRWEKTTQLNVGFDMSLFKNRVNVNFDAYQSITNDLLLNVPVPDLTGFSSQLTNIGKLQNSGIELNISTINSKRAFGWKSDFNFSMNRNKVLQLGPNNAPINYTDFSVAVRTEVGQPISNYYGYIFDGVYKNTAQINETPHNATTTPGDPIVRDVNGDGKITTDDRTIIGNYQPDFIAGFTNTFTYKNFEISALLQGSFGGKLVNQQTRFSGLWNAGRNAFASVSNYWKSESDPGDGIHFKPTVEPKGLQNQFSSYWVEDGSYLRVRNIRVAYNIDTRGLSKLGVKGARIYMNAENVFLFTKYSNYDPENTTYSATTYSPTATTASSVPSGAFLGVDYGSYPIPRVITFGIKADF